MNSSVQSHLCRVTPVGSVTVWGWNGSSGSGFRFQPRIQRFLGGGRGQRGTVLVQVSIPEKRLRQFQFRVGCWENSSDGSGFQLGFGSVPGPHCLCLTRSQEASLSLRTRSPPSPPLILWILMWVSPCQRTLAVRPRQPTLPESKLCVDERMQRCSNAAACFETFCHELPRDCGGGAWVGGDTPLLPQSSPTLASTCFKQGIGDVKCPDSGDPTTPPPIEPPHSLPSNPCLLPHGIRAFRFAALDCKLTPRQYACTCGRPLWYQTGDKLSVGIQPEQAPHAIASWQVATPKPSGLK